jgi:CRISPR/Cas system-associated protein Cas10 (large subunit of type III CRISPR-Cas system)
MDGWRSCPLCGEDFMYTKEFDDEICSMCEELNEIERLAAERDW